MRPIPGEMQQEAIAWEWAPGQGACRQPGTLARQCMLSISPIPPQVHLLEQPYSMRSTFRSGDAVSGNTFGGVVV